MEYTAMDQYWIWLSSIEGLGVKRFYQLLSEYEDARSVWDNVGPQMSYIGKKAYENLRNAKSEQYLYTLFAMLDQKKIHAISRLNDQYPPLLSAIYDPPPVLYVRGETDLSDEKTFAIVGSRTPTQDGRRAATEIAEGLSQEGIVVVSGMARGIDTCAHQGALKQHARTIAVLGCEVDIVYPPENDRLMAEIIDNGGSIISEYMPGTPPLGQHFPARNRIITGLCPGTLIVEAAKGSGAMISADNALEQGRDVFVVPGSIYSKLSVEVNRLLLTGALPVIGKWEILEQYRWAERPSQTDNRSNVQLTMEESIIVEPLRSEPLSFEEICQISNFPTAKLNSLLTMLELRGIISKVPGGMYRAKQ
ncbi:DNA-processing protein DprA [Eubacteriales bacterium OttesenSCG-928-N13]|nr:DNA-processing protein DprA [Eubacteriales bacterium OttesenSCG-928-N13]